MFPTRQCGIASGPWPAWRLTDRRTTLHYTATAPLLAAGWHLLDSLHIDPTHHTISRSTISISSSGPPCIGCRGWPQVAGGCGHPCADRGAADALPSRQLREGKSSSYALLRRSTADVLPVGSHHSNHDYILNLTLAPVHESLMSSHSAEMRWVMPSEASWRSCCSRRQKQLPQLSTR